MTSRYGVGHSSCASRVNLRVRSSRILFESREGSLEHERGGGGHLFPSLPGVARCFASAALNSLPFFFCAANLRPERSSGSQGGGFGVPALISDSYGGEGKTAS